MTKTITTFQKNCTQSYFHDFWLNYYIISIPEPPVNRKEIYLCWAASNLGTDWCKPCGFYSYTQYNFSIKYWDSSKELWSVNWNLRTRSLSTEIAQKLLYINFNSHSLQCNFIFGEKLGKLFHKEPVASEISDNRFFTLHDFALFWLWLAYNGKFLIIRLNAYVKININYKIYYILTCMLYSKMCKIVLFSLKESY